MKISVFGSTGFIGTRFCEMFPDIVIPVPRDEYTTEEHSSVLYLISTTHNYDTWEVNIETNINHLLKVLQHHDPKDTFNFVSSWFVYGDVTVPNEHVQPNPKGGNYNLTKLWAEQLVKDFCVENEIRYRIFRLANVFGKGDKFYEKKNALQYLINEMKHDRDIYLYNNGFFSRDYIHVDDVCEMLFAGMEMLPTNKIFNVGSGRPILFRDMILLAHTVLGSKSLIHNIEPSEFHKRIQIKDFWLDTTKINSYGILNRSSPFEKLYRMLKDDI